MANPGCNGTCTNTITTSFSRTPDTFIDTLVSSRVDTYLTRLIALLDGNPTIYYDQTFALPFGDLAANGAIFTAQNALQSQSANSLSFPGLTLDSTSTRLLSSTMQTVTIGDPVITETVGLKDTTGPGIILIGDLGTCSGLDITNNPVNCTGGTPTPFDLSDPVFGGKTNLNLNLNSQYQFTREIRTTDTYLTEATYRLVGIERPATSVPEPHTALPLLLVSMGIFVSKWYKRKQARQIIASLDREVSAV